MVDDRNRRLMSPNEKLKKIMDELGPDMMEYFEDISRVRRVKKAKSSKNTFDIGEIVKVGDNHGTVIYGPYKMNSKFNNYEIEMENGDIVTIQDDGHSVTKYTPVEIEKEEDVDDFL